MDRKPVLRITYSHKSSRYCVIEFNTFCILEQSNVNSNLFLGVLVYWPSESEPILALGGQKHSRLKKNIVGCCKKVRGCSYIT